MTITGVVALARDKGLFLQLHSDAEAMRRIFAQDREARILWAHAGFDTRENVRRWSCSSTSPPA